MSIFVKTQSIIFQLINSLRSRRANKVNQRVGSVLGDGTPIVLLQNVLRGLREPLRLHGKDMFLFGLKVGFGVFGKRDFRVRGGLKKPSKIHNLCKLNRLFLISFKK